MHTNDEKVSASAATCIDSVPLPTPCVHGGTYESANFEYFTADQLRAYGDERARAALRPILRQIGHEQYARAVAKYGPTDDPYSQALARVAELEDKLAEAEGRLRSIADHCRDVYAIVPSLPIEPSTMESATDALHAFCLMLGIERIDIEPTYKTDAAIAAGGGDGLST